MKLSNKILIGFFGCIFLYIILSTAEIRLKGDYIRLDESSFKTDITSLTGIKYLDFQDYEGIVNVITAPTALLQVKSNSESFDPQLNYEIKNDTLCLRKSKNIIEENYELILSFPTNRLKSIYVKNTLININALKQDSILLIQNVGEITIRENTQIDHLKIVSDSNRVLYLTDVMVKSLTMHLNNSNVVINGGIPDVEATMKNNSFLQINKVNNIAIQKDDESNVQIID